jgi:O-antigen/teichoic acid export membrane protein
MRDFTLKISSPNFLKQYFKKGNFIFNVGTLMAGSASAQLIVVLLMPIVTRLYLPDQFGVIAVILSIIGVLNVISCMRYEMAVVLPKTEDKSYNVVALCLALTLIISLILLVSVPFVSEQVESWVGMKGIKIFLYLVPLAVLGRGLTTTFIYWFTRKKNFAFIAKMRVILPLSANGSKIAAGLLFGSSAFWLIMGDILGIIIVTAIYAIFFLQSNYHQFKNSVSRQDIRAVAREYEKFPKYNSVAAITSALSENLPVFLFAYYFSAEFVGYYVLARKVLKKPLQLVAGSVRGVFFQRVADLTNKGKRTRPNLIKTTIALAATGIIPLTIIMVTGEWIFSMVFGAKWATAGFYAQILSPWLFTLFIVPPAYQVILVDQKLLNLLIFEIGLLASRAIAIISGYYISSDPWVAVALFCGVGIIANFIIILYAFKLTGTNKSPVDADKG